MIKLEPCRSCGRLLYVDALAGIDIRTETTLVDGPRALNAALDGTTLWAVRLESDTGRPLAFMTPTPALLGALTQPGPNPSIVAEHRCTKRGTEAAQAARRSSATPTRAAGAAQAPKARVAPNGTASSASQATSSPASPATRADRPRFNRTRTHHSNKSERTHPCHGCGQPVNLDGPAAFVAELGATVVFAAHAAC